MKGLFDVIVIIAVICGILAAGDPIMSLVIRVFPGVGKWISSLPLSKEEQQ